MKRIKTLIPGILLLLAINCTKDFEEVNTNPNFPEDVPANLLLTNALHQSFYNIGAQGWQNGNGLAQYTALWDFNDIERYAFDSRRSYWQFLYTQLRDIETLIAKGEEQANDGYIGIGKTMKALLASQLTDIWRDVPYFEAFEGKKGNYTPAYDTQQDIYLNDGGIIDLLAEADQLLSGPAVDVSGDIIYNGDLTKWRKFANSLRLRYLVRISSRHDVTAQIQSILDEGVIFESNDDNATLLSLASKPNQWYFFPVRDGDFNLIRLCNTMEEILKANNDPRINRWVAYTEESLAEVDAEMKYTGLPVGILNQTRSDLGFADLTKVSRMDSIFHWSPDEVHIVVMNYSEVQFLIAEALFRTDIAITSVNTIQEHYEEGIHAAFAYWKVAMPPAYLTGENVLYNPGNAYEQIITQKWLANFNVGYEGWLDFKRTGLPTLKELLDNANSGEVPSRFLYPIEEQSVNGANYQEALSRFGGSDNINYRHWWEN